MEIAELTQPNREYEETQEKLGNILSTIDELNEQYWVRAIEEARRSGSKILLELALQNQFTPNSSYRLPNREGQQTLTLNYVSKEANTSKDRDIVAEVGHDVRPGAGSEKQVQYVYTIRHVPDGDLYLEKHTRDLTESNRQEKVLNEVESLGDEDTRALVMSALHRTAIKDIDREIEAERRDKRLGLRLAADDDIETLAGLLAEAEAF